MLSRVGLPIRASARLLSTSAREIAFAFDIDGVLLRGTKPIAKAGDALRLLNKNKIPYILLTNGGGLLESQRVDFISKTLDVQISPLQIVQSHTPYKTLVNKYEKILAVGTYSVKDVAKKYGFKDVVHPIDIIKYNKSIAPFSGITTSELDQFSDEVKDLTTKPFDAVLVFNDPHDWAADLQVISDVINSDKGMLNTLRTEKEWQPSIPIYFSNNDLLWANQYNLNRFGQGAFRHLVRTLYSQMNNGLPLRDFIIGKPTSITYDFAHTVLIDWRNKLLNGKTNSTVQILPNLGYKPEESPFSKVFMVGDNPASDIIGAEKNGWESCLVKTGVYNDGDVLDKCTPTMIVDDAYAAVTKVLNEN
ncbi:similar to Saccharomyces cerevisiae YKR070W Putative protein of unknown function [Maudiozyma barnettii]|uniref:Uncharacterized protein n=1 Tax=Maudiozyma barnettii TaxID=61262 RepID=A0A8H2VI86_9SACH|nr:hypothetical protein [Kazachstania barnettii]CAB4256025.1 similar to Saccharomyces cerevisiae YKR070W Putative protein of unknown function [Kazachstania barnettii]CAD1784633.1 similar to Saccharomyces cerevisiae YKR070W Putative protein of unknown function [Kazachstania barnettii]